jgi:transcriptional regulator GlxA family with amidase domain
MSTVLFAVPARVHLLDLAGPAQAFSAAVDVGADYHLSYVGDEAVVASHQGLPLQLSVDWPALSAADTIVVPGCRVGSESAVPGLGTASLERIVAHHAAGGRVASVCSGAFALAEAHLLDGRRATTHHDVQEELARRFPAVKVVPDVLYVVDERVATSAGVASGIDLALHLIAVDHGPALAARVARSMVVHGRRNGAAPQESAMLRHRDHLSDVVHRVQDTLDRRFTESLPLRELAEDAGVSERTLTRLFRAATGLTPLKYQQLLRLEQADQLLSQGWTMDSAAQRIGLSDARMLRRLRAAR